MTGTLCCRAHALAPEVIAGATVHNRLLHVQEHDSLGNGEGERAQLLALGDAISRIMEP